MDKSLYTLRNKNGIEIDFISYGGKIKSIKLPSLDNSVDILLGYDSVDELINGDKYIGAICGRVTNRISNGTFFIDNVEYKLDKNEGTNSLHGGSEGFYCKYWNVETVNINGYEQAYKLKLHSYDGENGYPGNINVEIVYAINNNNELLIDIKANTDKITVINITNHPYFNLNGIGGGKIFNHVLEVNSSKFTPLKEYLIPTGEVESLNGKSIDFGKPKRVGDCISNNCSITRPIGGLDHNFILDKKDGELAYACRLTEPESGRGVEIHTTHPGLQVYSAMHFDGREIGKSKLPIQQYSGISLQPQNFPNAINNKNFPNSILKPDELYHEQIIYKFLY